MSITVTLANLISEIRVYADIPGTNFISDSILTTWINRAMRDLIDCILEVNKNYNISTQSINLVSGTQSYSLPTAFYKARGVDIVDDNGEWRELKELEHWEERNRLQDGAVSRSDYQYFVAGSNLMFFPAVDFTLSAGARLWYIPVATDMATGGSPVSMDGINGWEEFIIQWVTARVKVKRDEDVTQVLALMGDQRERIKQLARNRNTVSPSGIRNIYKREFGSQPWEGLPRP